MILKCEDNFLYMMNIDGEYLSDGKLKQNSSDERILRRG